MIPPETDSTGPSGLRTLVVADVLRRVLEHFHALRVYPTVVCPNKPDDLEHRLDQLWIRPPSRVATSPPSEPVDLIVTTTALASAGFLAPNMVPVAAVAPVELAAEATDELDDPLVLRMALLAARYRTPLTLGAAELSEAATTVERWRRRVAEWAQDVSAPIPPEHLGNFRVRLDDDLDVVGALAALEHLASDSVVPDGAKFETLAYADRILALDLVRYLGFTHG